MRGGEAEGGEIETENVRGDAVTAFKFDLRRQGKDQRNADSGIP